MSKITPLLQQLCFGDRNTFIFQETEAEQAEDIINKSEVTKLLIALEQKGYAITNPRPILYYTCTAFERFQNELWALITANTKEGLIFRKTFASEKELQEYTSEEWSAILAQYAITYNWTDDFKVHFNTSAETVLDNYVGSMDLTTINTPDNGAIKHFTIGDTKTLITITRNILESKTVLRAQQLATLNNTPTEIVVFAAKYANIIIKETLINTAKLLLKENLDYPLLRTPTDVVRFVAAHLTKGNSFEGQLTKAELAKLKLHISTSARKMLLNNMELIAYTNGGHVKGMRYICEDMIKFENFWKRLNKFLCYEPAKNKRRKYPQYTNAIDLLYSGDRSWTFNSRYEEAKKRGNYATAITVMAEKPTLLLRNLLEFMRMTTGTEFPQKETGGHAVTMHKPKNAFTEALNEKVIKKGFVHTIVDTVQTDATNYFNSYEFTQLLENKKTSRKVLWQIIEQLHNEAIYEPRFTREVQGQTINYTVPIPAVNKTLADKISIDIINALRNKTDNKRVFIDDSATGYKLQYSGRNSTEISFAGEFVTPGTELSLDALLKNKDIKEPLLRLGVMWRGKSMDIDHSLITSQGNVIYYGDPTLQIKNRVVISSSGDITTCSKDKFSTELIDIDLNHIDANTIEEMFNNFIVYSGGTSIGAIECYTFFSIIDKKDRVMQGQNVSLDLAKQDYAIRIDPENKDNTGSYIGCSINLKEGFIKVHALPIKGEGGHYSNARIQYNDMLKAINNAPATNGLTIDYAFKTVFDIVDKAALADIVLTKHEPDLHSDNAIEMGKIYIHPGRDNELIQQLLF